MTKAQVRPGAGIPTNFNVRDQKFKRAIGSAKTLWRRLANQIEFPNTDISDGISDDAIQIAYGGRYLISYDVENGDRRTKAELRGEIKREEYRADEQGVGSSGAGTFLPDTTLLFSKLAQGGIQAHMYWETDLSARKFKEDTEEAEEKAIKKKEEAA